MTSFSVFLESKYNCLMSTLLVCHSASLCWQRCRIDSSVGGIDGVESNVEVEKGDIVPGEIEHIAPVVLPCSAFRAGPMKMRLRVLEDKTMYNTR